MTPEAAHWISTLALQPHPEGGYFRETYRSAEVVAANALPARFAGARTLATSILYLLAAGEHSRFHRLSADEVWHFHAGGAMQLHLLPPGGEYRRLVVGPGEFQAAVPHDTWFAAEPLPGAAFSLVGCSVAPGFDYSDFETANRAELLAAHAAHSALITRCTEP